MHPRLKHYPHHADYMAHANEYRPFVDAMGQPNFRSRSLNSDELGFRVQHYRDGEPIDFNRLKSRVQACNLMLGSSTAFGVTATADRNVTPALLTQETLPCINWAVRGATCQQELILYLTLRYLLPEQRNIVLLTGMNDVCLAVMRGAIAYPHFGSIFGEDFFFRQFVDYVTDAYRTKLEQRRLREWVDGLWRRSEFVRWLTRYLMRKSEKQVAQRLTLSPEEQFSTVCRHLANTMETWGAIQSSSGSRLHYVLQPALGWTAKPLAPVEAECFGEDMRTIPTVPLFTDHALYVRFRDHAKSCCDAAGIRFYDANEWFGEPRFAAEDVFTDSCHFNDRGYGLLAGMLRERLDWR